MNKHAKHICSLSVIAATLAAVMAISGCNSKVRDAGQATDSTHTTMKPIMQFNADTAYSYIADQVAMGPRVPGSEGSRACAKWIIDRLAMAGADSIITQSFTATAHTGDKLPLTNIMGRFGDVTQPRILLVAHYDTRPWADRERSHDLVNKPIPGANDGGSGVAVLLEIARQISAKRPAVAVDMLFVDGEDYGKSDGWSNNDTTWCLGSQYWTSHMPDDYNVMLPRYGILLDMVGGRHAHFMREFISDRFAPEVLDKIWQIAEASGYGSVFINKQGGSAIDDHLFINNAGIPTVDIIDCDNAETSNFPATWHTHADNLNGIDPSVLNAVGQTVTNVIYREKP